MPSLCYSSAVTHKFGGHMALSALGKIAYIASTELMEDEVGHKILSDVGYGLLNAMREGPEKIVSFIDGTVRQSEYEK